MYDWIREAEICRLRQALTEATEEAERDSIAEKLKAAEAQLGIVTPPVAERQSTRAKPKPKDRFGGKSLWERPRG